MKALVRFLIATCIALGAMNAHAQRVFDQGELDALLAPIALYPDPLLMQVLTASQFPDEVMAAATWSRANPQLQGDAALRTVDGQPWNPSVKALVAYPEVLQRMAESPQWLADLGEAYATYGPNVMATVQELRARAQASGYLQSNDQQYVYQQGQAIYVQPVYPNVVYVPYYNPYVVYGPWWAVYRPVYWRPWVPHPVFFTRVVVAPPVHWHVFAHRQFVRGPIASAPVRGPQVLPYRSVPEANRQPIINSAPPAYRAVPESRRAPIIQGPAIRSAAPQAQSAPISQPRWSAPHASGAMVNAPRASVSPQQPIQPRFSAGFRASGNGGVGHAGGGHGGGAHGGGGGNRGHHRG